MLVGFFNNLRTAGVPCTLRELLDLISALDANLAFSDLDDFYRLSRVCLVKDERHYDRFDRSFGSYFSGLENLTDALQMMVPEDWLRDALMKSLTDEEKAKIKSLGDLDELIKAFKERLAEQEGRHQGGSKWIGTGGTSPFGAYGYHPEGIRVGQEGSNNRRAVKVWDKREFRNLDGSVELGTRNIKMALRRLRKFARTGAPEHLDMENTISATAKNAGYLDLKMIPERHNAIKVLLFFDVGGSMDDHIRICEELFSASRSEFKHMEYYYFHNFIYESIWQDNARRHQERLPLMDILHTFSRDYRLVFVGDASMSPYEITHSGGSVEHFNEEPGAAWFHRLRSVFDRAIWLNPTHPSQWRYTQSILMTQQLMEGHMYPLTLEGLEQGIGHLSR